MNIVAKKCDLPKQKADAYVISIFEGLKQASDINISLDPEVLQTIQQLIKQKSVKGKVGELTVLFLPPHLNAHQLIICGLGPKKSVAYKDIRSAAGNVVRKVQSAGGKKIVWAADSELFKKLDSEKIGQVLAEGLIMGSYRFTAFKSKAAPANAITNVTVATSESKTTKPLNTGIQNGIHGGEAVCIARDLENTPANHLTPQHFVDKAKAYLKGIPNVTLKSLTEKDAEKMGMGAFLGVAKGSSEKPFMLVINYNHKKGIKPICLVGKGVTFDTGGISIKPSAKMSEMKADMSGAAVVFASILAIAKSGIDQSVSAVIPLVENMPAGNALKPGDVITAMNGKTIEVLNTDAEGRLILADALCYAESKLKAKEIIDVATLTGACLVALGTLAAGALGNKQSMINQLLKISDFTHERLWQLPLFDDYLDQLKSDVADLANCYEGREGGTITAAKFLQQFVGNTPWVHLDIASVMSNKKNQGEKVKGMSGEGVRNLIEYVKSTT